MAATIFVNYRVTDSAFAAGLIYDSLVERFGAVQVFRDCDSMPLGDLYPSRIRKAVQKCRIMVSVIGPSWLDARDPSGLRRIDNPSDWVRLELGTAFQRGTRVIPVLLDSTCLPGPDQLPDDLRALSYCQFHQVRSRRADADVADLVARVAALEPTLVPSSTAPAGHPRPPTPSTTPRQTAAPSMQPPMEHRS